MTDEQLDAISDLLRAYTIGEITLDECVERIASQQQATRAELNAAQELIRWQDALIEALQNLLVVYRLRKSASVKALDQARRAENKLESARKDYHAAQGDGDDNE